MTSKPKVAISTIFHPTKEYAYKLFLDWAKSVEYENLEFIVKVHTGEYGGNQGELKAIREQIRQDAVDLDVSALLSVDVDTIGPVDAIQEFLEMPADMMTGIYFSRIDPDRAVCWKNDDNEQQFLNTEVYSKVTGAGMGFCFMRRSVLDAIAFDWPVPDDDYPAWHQAKEKGFRLLSLNMMRCRHYSSATSFSYHEFGEVRKTNEDYGVTEYAVVSPDGITVNGNHYPHGKVIASQSLLETIMELDAPYRTGKIKTGKRRVDVVGKKESGVTPAHSQKQQPTKAPDMSKKKEGAVVWKRSR